MSLNIFGNISKFYLKGNASHNLLSFRYARTRHRDVKFIIMNNYQPWPKPFNIKEIFGNFDTNDPSQMRDHMRRNGLLPSKSYFDKIINMNCSMSVIDDFIPPEGDGKSSLLSSSKLTETKSAITSQYKNLTASNEIRKYDGNFKNKTFVEHGESIYRQMLILLPNYKENETRLLDIVTEMAFTDMVQGLENKTLLHTFHKHLEEPSVVSVRTSAGLNEGEKFAQVMLRFFSEQTIAIFDKFGRLIYGSHDTPQDVLEYVVFEKLITEEYSSWRVHAKVIPNWVKNNLVYHRTMRKELEKIDDNVSDV